VQLQTLLLAAIEPTTRLVIGHFGTLSAVADFSLASRFVIQMRALIFSGAQPLLAAFSHDRNNPGKIAELYRSAQATVASLAMIIFSGSIAAAPFVEEAWTGSSAGMFTIFAVLLSVGWLANTVTLPSYFNAYSLGKMNRSLLGHALLCVANLVLGVGLALWFGSVGAVAGLAAALIVSSIFLGVANGRLAPSDARGVFGYQDVAMLAISSAASACGFAAYFIARQDLDPIFAGLASGLVWAIVLIPAFAFHQALRAMTRQLKGRFSPKR
jgi:O-antigen/teichoic acid export membrane protein